MMSVTEKETVAHQIISRLNEAGFEAFFAGGCVRDKLLGIAPKDFDIATSALPDQIQALFSYTVPVGVQFGVIMVIEQGMPFEVATFRTEGSYRDGRRPDHVSFASVSDDAKRRDFTVNGLYFDPKTNNVLDFVNGQNDLKSSVLRTIGEPESRFLEDHLRLLRAVRFSVQLDFQIEPQTLNAVKKHASLITKVSAERVRDELSKILTSRFPARGIRLLDELGMLELVLPEVITLKGVEQPSEYHPEGDVYIHTLMLLDQLSEAPLELAWGALLHDIAKPATFERAADRIRFHGHDKIGADMSRVILKRLHFSNDQIDLICSLVNEHLRFKDAFQMRKSTLRRFFSLPRFDLHMALHKIDCMASHGKLDAYHFCQTKLAEFAKLPPPPSRLVTGKDLQELGVPPGKIYQEFLRQVEDAVLEGQVTTRDEALSMLQRLVKEGS